MAADGAKKGPILDLDGVVAGYGGAAILNGVNFAVHRAAITTIIGANGAGKSTIFKAIFGLLPVRHGTVRFDGEDVTNARPRQLLERGLCYIPQGRNAFPEMSVRHNLELGAIAAGRLRDLAKHIDAAMDYFPVLREKANLRASALNGGEQKQLEIARGLVLAPLLMLIDEPSIGLSSSQLHAIFAVLTELRGKGVTVLMIEQNAKSALGLSDYAIVLELGRTRHQDRAAAILADPRIGQLFLGGAMGSSTPPPSTLSWMQP